MKINLKQYHFPWQTHTNARTQEEKRTACQIYVGVQV